MKDFLDSMNVKLASMSDFALLILRLVLAAGFFNPAMGKIKGFTNVVGWFKDTLHLPFPELNAIMATGTEALGVVLLVLGYKTRLISVPLMVVMIVALVTVHGAPALIAEHGISLESFEKLSKFVAMNYFFMLFILATVGPGKFSIDKG